MASATTTTTLPTVQVFALLPEAKAVKKATHSAPITRVVVVCVYMYVPVVGGLGIVNPPVLPFLACAGTLLERDFAELEDLCCK